MTDDQLIDLANSERRILITNDKDFGELVFRQGRVVEGLILLRVKGQDSLEKVRVMRQLIEHYSEKLSRCFVVATKSEIRVIPFLRLL
jgi:predicted nuclease of predicted toxin-antitoxin system